MAKQDHALAIKQWAEKNEARVMELLPRQVDKGRFIRSMVFQVANNPAIAGCDQRSVIESVLQAASLGLDIGVLGSAYLVPFKNKAQLIIGYRGLLDLARRSGALASVHAEVVCANDEYQRTAEDFTHQWDPFADRGEMIGAYAKFHLNDGSIQVETMSKAEIDSVRARSRASTAGPWVTDYNEMAKKTVLRRGLKKVGLSVEVSEALQKDDAATWEQADVQVRNPGRKALERALAKQGEGGLDLPEEEGENAPEEPAPTPPRRSSPAARQAFSEIVEEGA